MRLIKNFKELDTLARGVWVYFSTLTVQPGRLPAGFYVAVRMCHADDDDDTDLPLMEELRKEMAARFPKTRLKCGNFLTARKWVIVYCQVPVSTWQRCRSVAVKLEREHRFREAMHNETLNSGLE